MQNFSKFHKFGMTALTIVVILLLIFFHFRWGYWIFGLADGMTREGNTYNEWHYWMTVQDNIYSAWWDHSTALLDVETKIAGQAPEVGDLDSLAALPGVVDAFFVSMPDSNVLSVNHVIPHDSLTHSPHFLEEMGCRVLYTNRQLGGLTRFKTIGNHPVLFRVIGMGYDFIMPQFILGLVLDENWLLEQLPSRLDSLGKNSLNLTMFGPFMTDSMRNLQDDPYTGPGGWKRTLGVLHGKDTLWWSGDPDVQKPRYMDLDAFNLRILNKAEKPDFKMKTVKNAKLFFITLLTLDIIAALLLYLLYRTIRLHRDQARRNRIALAHFAHAIKTPVARLRLGSDMLRDEQVASAEDEKSLIESISAECDRLELSVKNAAMAIEQGKIRLNKETQDMVELTSSVLDAWTNTSRQYGIRLEKKLPDASLECRIDREMMRILLDNLIDNALRYTYLNKSNLKAEKAVVHVELARKDDHITLTIDDSGKGIAEDQRKTLFKGLDREKTGALTGASGLGLGLMIVQQIVRAHHGGIEVSDSECGGARFAVRLPV